jgi:HK97 family phage prohead protease
MLLGRQSSGTLKVWADSRGLGFELALPKTSYANDVRELASRGDLGGMSIGFQPGEESWSAIGKRELRTHISVARLVEISPVSIPAYDDTTAQLRSLDHITTKTPIDLRTQIALAKVRANRKATN